MREEDLPQAHDAEEEEEADDSPGNRTDMELAWENLEVAKLIYERENAASYAKELAGKHFPPIFLSASDNMTQPTCFCNSNRRMQDLFPCPEGLFLVLLLCIKHLSCPLGPGTYSPE